LLHSWGTPTRTESTRWDESLPIKIHLKTDRLKQHPTAGFNIYCHFGTGKNAGKFGTLTVCFKAESNSTSDFS